MADRGDPAPAPPARRPATAAATPPEPGLGRPGTPGDPAQRDTESPPPRAAAAGHPGHDPALAPRHHPPPLGRQIHPRQDRPASHPPDHQGPDPPARPREPRLGIPQNPRRASRPGSDGSGAGRVGNPEECRDRPRAAASHSRHEHCPRWLFRSRLAEAGEPGGLVDCHRRAVLAQFALPSPEPGDQLPAGNGCRSRGNVADGRAPVASGGIPPNRATRSGLPSRRFRASKQVRVPSLVSILAL